MLSHSLSLRTAGHGGESPRLDPSRRRDRAGVALPVWFRFAWGAGGGSLRVERHVAARLQGARLDSRILPLGARPRRLCRSVLLSGLGSPGDRRRRECADGGDRRVDRPVHAFFGCAGAIVARALRHQRDAEDRRRGACDVERNAQDACGDRGRGRLRRSRSQVSDLGAWSLSKRARGGHPKGARAQGGAGIPGAGARCVRSTGMTAGSGGPAAAGGPALHIPVLGAPALEHLNVHDGGVYIDGTFGAGGYTRAILGAADCKVIGIDRDQSAIALGADLVESAGSRLTLVEDWL